VQTISLAVADEPARRAASRQKFYVT